MNAELILQIFALTLGVWFTYIGARNLLSKKYYVDEVEETKGKTTEEKYQSLPRWRVLFTRFSLGGQWLVLGLGLLALFIYSLFK